MKCNTLLGHSMDINGVNSTQNQNLIGANDAKTSQPKDVEFQREVDYSKTPNLSELYGRVMAMNSDVDAFKEKLLAVRCYPEIPNSCRKYTDDQVREMLGMYRRNPEAASKYIDLINNDNSITSVLISLYKEREDKPEEFEFLKKISNKVILKDGKEISPYNGGNIFNLLKIHSNLDKGFADELAEELAENPVDKNTNIFGILSHLRERVDSQEEFSAYITPQNAYPMAEKSLSRYKYFKSLFNKNLPRTDINNDTCINLALMSVFNKAGYLNLKATPVFDKLVSGEFSIELLEDLKFDEKIDDPNYLENPIKNKKETTKDYIIETPAFDEYNKETLCGIVDIIDDPTVSEKIITSIARNPDNAVVKDLINFYITPVIKDLSMDNGYSLFKERKDTIPNIINSAREYPEQTEIALYFADSKEPELTKNLIETLSETKVPAEYLDRIYNNFASYGSENVSKTIDNIVKVLDKVEPNEKEYSTIVDILNLKDPLSEQEIVATKKDNVTQIKVDDIVYTLDGDNNVSKEKIRTRPARLFSKKNAHARKIIYSAHLKDDQHITSSIKEVEDKDGKHLYTEYYVPSKTLANKFEIWRKDKNGKHQIGFAEKLPNGTKIIEKALVANNGVKTYYVYVEDINENRMTNIQISDKDKNVLFSSKQIFKKIDDNHFHSNENGVQYDIHYYDDKVVSKNENTGETVEISIGEGKVIKPSMVELCKKLFGSHYFMIQKGGLTTIDDDYVLEDNASYNSKNNGIHFGIKNVSPSKEFSLFHEFGHYKDHKTHRDRKISDDEKLQALYNEELSELMKNGTVQEIEMVKYFVEPKKGADEQRPLREVIAESHAFLYGNNNSDYLENRGDYLLQYFPKTMAYAMSKLI